LAARLGVLQEGVSPPEEPGQILNYTGIWIGG